MRESFEKYLQEQNTLAKKELEQERESLKAGETSEFEVGGLDDLLEKGAEEQSGNVETQEYIYIIQKEKQRVMAKLKEDLARLDNEENEKKYLVENDSEESEGGEGDEGAEESEESEENDGVSLIDLKIEDLERVEEERKIESFNEEEQVFLYRDKRENLQEATLGEVITDLEWDINYDVEEIDGAPRLWKKKYLIEKAKKTLLKLADEQIIRSEMDNNTVGDIIQDTYENIQYGREIGADKRKEGFVSEIMVRSFLRQLAFDKGLPIKVQEADVFQDVEEKIDFIIERQKDILGVQVTEANLYHGEEEEEKSSVAVQFSTNPKAEERKRKQIQRLLRQKRRAGEEVQNMALVIFSKLMAGDLKKEWDRAGRPAGGPVKFMKGEVKKELFEKILQTLFTKEELEDEWGQMVG